MDTDLLRCENMTVCYGEKRIVSDIHFSLNPGEILGVVGESGSGKSTIFRALLGILKPGGRITDGTIVFRQRNLPELSEKEMRKIRGREIGMIFQDSGASLCPIRTIGAQMYESMSAHRKITKKETACSALEIFERLGLEDGERILRSYPFMLSGGMNQRVGIAMAMLHRPPLLLADEPTSALDTVTQKQTVEEMLALREIYDTAIILVTHNIGVVEAMADKVLVLHEGRQEEYGPAAQVLRCPQAEYTKELLVAVPRLRRKGSGKHDETDTGSKKSDSTI